MGPCAHPGLGTISKLIQNTDPNAISYSEGLQLQFRKWIVAACRLSATIIIVFPVIFYHTSKCLVTSKNSGWGALPFRRWTVLWLTSRAHVSDKPAATTSIKCLWNYDSYLPHPRRLPWWTKVANARLWHWKFKFGKAQLGVPWRVSDMPLFHGQAAGYVLSPTPTKHHKNVQLFGSEN